MQKAILTVVPNESHERHPNHPRFAIGWDGHTIVSSAVASVVDEAFCETRQRSETLERFEKAKNLKSGAIDLHSGNGPNAITDGKLILFDHDFFPNKKALLSAEVLPALVVWLEQLEAMGFPNDDADYPTFEFEYIADGPHAENEFLLATGHRWPDM